MPAWHSRLHKQPHGSALPHGRWHDQTRALQGRSCVLLPQLHGTASQTTSHGGHAPPWQPAPQGCVHRSTDAVAADNGPPASLAAPTLPHAASQRQLAAAAAAEPPGQRAARLALPQAQDMGDETAHGSQAPAWHMAVQGWPHGRTRPHGSPHVCGGNQRECGGFLALPHMQRYSDGASGDRWAHAGHGQPAVSPAMALISRRPAVRAAPAAACAHCRCVTA
jgi:hypothetical protein